MIRKYLWNLLIAFDQLANAITFGDPDETISSRCGKKRKTNIFCRWFCALLDKIDPGHTDRSIENDEGSDAIFVDSQSLNDHNHTP